MDVAALQVALILLPGVIWALLDANYGAQVKRDQLTVITRAILFGFVSYAVTYVGYELSGRQFTFPGGNESRALDRNFADEIVVSVLVSLVLGTAWLYSQTYRLTPRLLRLMRATNRYGNEDVWDHTLNVQAPETEYVNVRHFARQLVYCGFIETFSSSERARELLLRDVAVYDLEGPAAV